MLEPMTSYNDTPTTNGRYVKHIRSSSTLTPMPETPNSRRIVHQRSTSNIVSNGVNRVTSFASPTRHASAAAKTLNQQQLQQRQLHKSTSNLSSRPDGTTAVTGNQQQQQQQLHKSTSNLSSRPDGTAAVTGNHQRSSSTPYEGFVV